MAHRIWRPTSSKGDLDLRHTVLPWLLDLKKRYSIGRILYDPYNMSTLAQMGRESGLRMEELPQTQGNQTLFTGALLDSIRSGSLQVYGADDLREQVLNAVMIETARGIRLAKEKASRKIDAAVALAMAVFGAQKWGSRVRPESFSYAPDSIVVPSHQADSLRTLYGKNIPAYAIDTDGR